MKTFVTPGFHSDVVWLEDQRDYAVSLFSDFRQHLLAAKRDPDFGFFVHELTYLKPYLDSHPEDRDFLRQLIAEGRVGTGGSHSQPSETIVQGESLIRNIQYGRWYHEGFLHDRPEIYMPWDVFGHTSQLAQILKKSRFLGCIWSKNIRGARAVFWHQSQDGSILLFRRVDYGLGIDRGGRGFPVTNEEEFWEHIAQHTPEMASLGFSVNLRLDAVDFKPPSAWVVGKCGRFKEGKGVPQPVIFSGVAHRHWFREAKKEIKEKNLDIPVLARDFEWHHQGTALSRAEFKIANRIAESRLLDAEKWATLAALYGASYPDRALDKAWRQLLFLHHHDAITGTMNDRSYLDLMSGLRESLELASETRSRAAGALASLVNTEKTFRGEPAIPIVIFNSLNWNRTDLVELSVDVTSLQTNSLAVVSSAGENILFEVLEKETDSAGLLKRVRLLLRAEEVPSFGYATFYIRPSKEPLPEAKEVESFEIENEFFKIEVDPLKGGHLVSIFDKKAGREILDTTRGFGNEIVVMEEVGGRREPSWEVFTDGVRFFSRNFPATVRVLHGPLTQKILVQGKTHLADRYQVVTLARGIRRIDFETEISNHTAPHWLYAVTFPVKLKGAEPIFEDRFGFLTKRKSKGKFSFQTSQAWNYSEAGVRKANRWIELGTNGQILKGKMPVATFGMTHLLYPHDREVQQLGFALQSALIRRGIPVSPTYDDYDWPRRKSLPHEDSILPKPEEYDEDLPYGTSFRISLDVESQNKYTQRVLEQLPESTRRAFESRLKEDGTAVLLTVDEKIPDGWSPLPVLLISAKDSAVLRSRLESLAEKIAESGQAVLASEEVDERGHFSLDDYGVALLNIGTELNSVEKDNTLVHFLFHTAAWGGASWEKDKLPFFLVPEFRRQRFFYSLYPHSGDVRQGHTVQKGWEINTPLLAEETTRHPGPLSEKMAFIQTDSNQVVLTSFKPADNPTARLHAGPVDLTKGVALRGYETWGDPHSLSVRTHFTLKGASLANLMEEKEEEISLNGNSFEFSFGPNAIETFLLKAEMQQALTGTSLGKEKENMPALFSRFWTHNVGAAPLGYAPVGITLLGQIQSKMHIDQSGVTVAEFQVGVVNNYVNRPLETVVEIEVPEPWRVLPEKIEISLPPGGHTIETVTLDLGPWRGPKEGFIRARLSDGADEYEDVLEISGTFTPGWNTNLKENQIIVTLENPWRQKLTGAVEIISPTEAWPESIIGKTSILEIGPRLVPFELEPGETKQVVFRASLPLRQPGTRDDDLWIIAKLMCNGHVDYKPVMGRIR